MNARGDMMPKAVNLTDMLWQRTEGNQADRAREKAGGKGAAASRAQAPRAEFIPEQPTPARQEANSRSAAPKTFFDRVKESQSRLASRGHAFFKQPGKQVAEPGSRDAQPGHRAGRADEAADAGSREAGRSVRSKSAEGAHDQDMHVRRGTQPGQAMSKPGRKAAEEGRAPEVQAWTPGESRPIDLEAVEADASLEAGTGGDRESQPGALPDEEALQARLEELGLAVTPEQLRDPAFLAEMLWMIDGIPPALPATGEALPGTETLTGVEAMPSAAEAQAGAVPAFPASASETASAGAELSPNAGPADLAQTTGSASSAAPAAGQASEGPSTQVASNATAQNPAAPVPAGEFDWTLIEEPAREEIAALLRGKLGALSDMPAFRAGPGQADPALASDAGQPLQARTALAEAGLSAMPQASRADLALADPDRLRVLQTAGLEALSGMGAVPAPDKISLRLETDEAGPLPEASGDEDITYLATALPAADEAEGREDGGSLPDLLGRGQGQPAVGETAGQREGAAVRDAGATPFQSALEQARVSEARHAQQAKAPVLHFGPSGTEQAVLAQIARKMSALGMRGTDEIRIQLEPEHLGRVRIALELRDGGMNARIAVENDSVRQVVDQNLAGLKESLESQGIKLQGLEVSVEHRHASLFNPDGSNAREFFRQRGNGGDAGAAEAASEAEAEPETGRRLGYNTLEFIA